MRSDPGEVSPGPRQRAPRHRRRSRRWKANATRNCVAREEPSPISARSLESRQTLSRTPLAGHSRPGRNLPALTPAGLSPPLRFYDANRISPRMSRGETPVRLSCRRDARGTEKKFAALPWAPCGARWHAVLGAVYTRSAPRRWNVGIVAHRAALTDVSPPGSPRSGFPVVSALQPGTTPRVV